MASALVTGAAGFIGRHVARAAEAAGFEVRPLTRGTVDLCHPLDALPPSDWVFHLAGGYAGLGWSTLQAQDVAIARNLLDWAEAEGVRNWVVASAAEVYGEISGAADEEHPTSPVIPYGRAKLEVERLFKEYAARTPRARVVLLRIGEVYGPKCKLLAELGRRLKSGFCPWPGSGRVPLSFVHVEDVARVFTVAAMCAGTGVSIWNVADDAPATWRDFTEHFAALERAHPPHHLPVILARAYAAGSSLVTRHAVRLLLTPKVLDTARLKAQLGVEFQFPDWRTGLEHALSHHAENG